MLQAHSSMSFQNSSSRAGLNDFLHGQVPSGSAIHGFPIWYSDPGAMSCGVAFDLVPRSAGLQFPSNHLHSPSTSLFTLTLLTLTPTNSLNLPNSVLSMPRTADESVKNLIPANGILNATLVFFASLTELAAATRKSYMR
jgi:hypothetical protein